MKDKKFHIIYSSIIICLITFGEIKFHNQNNQEKILWSKVHQYHNQAATLQSEKENNFRREIDPESKESELTDTTMFLSSQVSSLMREKLKLQKENPIPIEEFILPEEAKDFFISKEEFPVTEIFTGKFLNNGACQEEDSLEYFDEILSIYNSEDVGTKYSFELNQPSQPGQFHVTVIPNKFGPNYKNFQNDFERCYAGGRYYPKLHSEKYLLFISSCGSGGGGNYSQLPRSCDSTKTIIADHLILN